MSDTTYCYPPDYTVLKNKASLRDAAALERYEHLQTQSRAYDCPLDLPISYAGYKALHHHVFQDVYEWAGESRRVTIHKGDMFAHWMYVDQEMDKRFKLLNGENNLQALDLNAFAVKASEHLSEINAIHPFREGNGRIQRLFLRNLAHQAGHDLVISRIDRDQWMQASIEGFRQQNYDRMEKVIYSAVAGRARTHDRDPHDRGR